jgi:hypothetical protein
MKPAIIMKTALYFTVLFKTLLSLPSKPAAAAPMAML